MRQCILPLATGFSAIAVEVGPDVLAPLLGRLPHGPLLLDPEFKLGLDHRHLAPFLAHLVLHRRHSASESIIKFEFGAILLIAYSTPHLVELAGFS